MPALAYMELARDVKGLMNAAQIGTDAVLYPSMEGVSDLLITCQTDAPNSYRLMKSPITKSCMCSVLEKQIVRRTNRLIRVRKLMCLLSIFCVCRLPHRVLLCLDMPLVGTPAVGEIARDAKGLQQRFEFQKDRILPSSKHIG